MKKFLSLIIAFLLCAMMSTPSFAFSSTKAASKQDVLLINTIPVPQEANVYAIQVFSTFDESTYDALSIEISEENDISLSPGFCMVNSDTSEYVKNLYYYLIKSGDRFVGMLLISYHNGEYGFQISKAPYVDGINNLSNDITESYEIVYSNVGHFCTSEKSIYALSTNKNISKQEVDKYTSNLSAGIKRVSSTQMTQVVNILNPIFKTTIDSKSDRSNTSFVLGVPYCSNNEVYGNGVCWASVAASVIVYKLHGVFYEPGEAETMRDTIVNNRIQTTGSTYGTIDTIRQYINLALLQDYYKCSSKLPFNDIVTLIDAASPCAIELTAVGSNATYGHAAVIAGYSYVPNQTNTQMYYIMDPNCTSTFIGVGYSSVYTTSPYYIVPGVNYFVWTDTVIDGDDL